MRLLLIAFVITSLLSGCSILPIHKMDIEQGNVMSTSQIQRLRVGMSRSQVANIMGQPILMNTFADNRSTYVYTFKRGGGRMSERYVTLSFHNGYLASIQSDKIPG
jgi:outer membrane protein assembly factor BamE